MAEKIDPTKPVVQPKKGGWGKAIGTLARAAAGDMGLGQLYNTVGDVAGAFSKSEDIQPRADETASSSTSITSPMFVTTTKQNAKDEMAKVVAKLPEEKKQAAQAEFDSNAATGVGPKTIAVVDKYKSVLTPQGTGKTLDVAQMPERKSILDSISQGMGRVTEEQMDTHKNYDAGYYNTLDPRAWAKQEIGMPRILKSGDSELKANREARLAGQKDNEYLRIYLKKSQNNMEQLKLFDEVTTLLSNKTPIGAATLRYKLARIANGGGVLTQQDVDQSYAPGGSMYMVFGEKLRKIFANPTDDPIDEATRKTLFNYAKQKVQVDIDNQFKNRENYGMYLDAKNVNDGVKKSILFNDNLGAYDSQENWKKGYWEPKIKELEKVLGSGGATWDEFDQRALDELVLNNPPQDTDDWDRLQALKKKKQQAGK